MGHELVPPSSSDLIFCNDPQSYSPDLRKNNKGAIIIYNVLDYPPHLINPTKYDLSMYSPIRHNWNRDFDVEGLTEKLKQADLITTICDHVTWQVRHFSNLEAHTIFNPIKPIFPLNLHDFQKIKNNKGEPYKYLAVGRLLDVNKRNNLIIPTLRLLDEGPDKLALVGSENIYFGDFYGEVDDEKLNLFFNSVQYLFLLSAFKSLALPAIEAVCAGVIPIVTEDDPVTAELFPGIGVPNTPYGIKECLQSNEWNRKAREFVDNNSLKYREKFSPQQICKNILKLIK